MNQPYGPLLDHLESGEDPLLSWGVVDGGFTRDELLARINKWLLKHDPLGDAEDILQDLKRRGLAFRDDSTVPERWRTRSAEAIRLIMRLRQIFFPSNEAAWPDAWRHGATLVSDYRYLRRARGYPRRDQPSQDVVASLEALDPLQQEALRVLTQGEGKPISLAGFQVRALHQILSDLQSGRSRGVVVGAGTGSGKTLGFYLPALAHLVRLHDDRRWTRVIAIYPRNELLRDQLAGAFAQARRLDGLLGPALGRPLRIGAYLGQTPTRPGSVEGRYVNWPKAPAGRRCPYLVCPGPAGLENCGGDLIWREDDRTRGLERLVCSSCGSEFGDEMVALTRNRMADSPPDLLFATTEMLNRSLSDVRAGRVFGVGVNRPPQLMLLDEIHTYAGTAGAQTAMVLRRWRNRLGRPVSFVGLSATLREPSRFFADLVGLLPDAVTEIEPQPEELEHEGAEYLLAVRSDPTSGSSVLSATIQASMLIARTLDPPATRPSGGLYGSRLFVFTDDLDVTNRLYYDLLDAEGQRLDGRGRPRAHKEALAILREPALGPSSPRRAAGQSWDLPEIIGHRLSPGERLGVGRTSSQDIGVDREAQVIVATASLEVGFDDPDVGAVLQHKAPRSAAQFIQRRGRGGRPRQMRPWSIVVLSDYGRDREAYQAWDVLFDPVLPARALPIRNRHVLRMHAIQCVLDWVAERLRDELPDLSLWRDIAGPVQSGPFAQQNAMVQRRVADELDGLLSDPLHQADLSRWVGRMLQLPASEVDELLWYPPRAVLLSAVPTLVRRLRSNWGVAEPSQVVVGRDRTGKTPLPDYFPSNLFSELSLPEVIIRTPAQVATDEGPEDHPMDVGQALREFAPGRVSRRFVTRNAYQRHWVPAPPPGATRVEVDTIFLDHETAAEVDILIDERPQTLDLVRPFLIGAQLTPDEVRDSSNAFLRWASEFIERGEGISVKFPADDPIGRLVTGARFHLHADQSNLEVRRAAHAVDASLILDNGQETRSRANFTRSDGSPVAVGAVYDVDGLRMDIAVPNDLDLGEPLPAGLKSAWFRHVIVSDEGLGESANVFQLGWVHDAVLVTLVRRAVTYGISLAEAFAAVRPSLLDELDRSIEILFQRVGLIIEDEDVTTGPARLRGTLTALLREDRFMSRVGELLPELWKPSVPLLDPWLRTRLLVTVGEAVMAAARLSCPEHDPEGLLLDVEPGVGPDGRRTGEVWVTESTIGGGGFLEALAGRIRKDPRRFLRLVRRMLRPTDAEIVDASLGRFLESADDPALHAAVDGYRGAVDQSSRLQALVSLRAALRTAGIGDDHAVVSAIVNRLLRPGSTTALDDAVRSVVEDWKKVEVRLGVELDARTWAYLASDRTELDRALPGFAGGDPQQRRLEILQSVLWPRGWQVRSAALRSWNPFSSPPDAAPDILRGLLLDSTPRVDLDEDDARAKVRDHLAGSGAVVVLATTGREAEAARFLIELMTEPIQLEFLQVHPRIAEVERTALATEIRLELLEVGG